MAQTATTATTAAEGEPTVALLSQSNRTWQTEVALDTTPIPYTVDPADPWSYDVLVIETPDRRMFRHVVAGQPRDTTVLFRMRGDPYWGIDEWYDHPVPPVRWGKRWLALKQLEWVDGCVAIAEHQADKYRSKTGNPTEIVQLSRDVDRWPDSTHTDDELRLLSLTNCMYPQKVRPLIEYAPTVADVLDSVGGEWVIGGRGRYADELRQELAPFDTIRFPGYVDAHERLQEANCMLHLSYFDSFAGAVLEGLASRLPVITTDHPAFTQSDLPVDSIDGSANRLRALLREYSDPDRRAARGRENEAYVAERYSHERVGERWAAVLREFAEA